MQARLKVLVILPAIIMLSLLASGVFAQRGEDEPEEENKTVIKRQPVVLKDPRSYKIAMRLEPAKSIALTAPVDGVVRSLHATVGEMVKSQNDVVRMDDTRAALVERAAKAAADAKRIQQKIAETKNDPDLVALASAEYEEAKAKLDLAQLDHERMIVRSPFVGTILKVYVVENQFVRAGDPLVELGDVKTLHAQVPVDRKQTSPNTPIEIKVENRDVRGTVLEIQPPGLEMEPLRELVDSLATATVTVDNSTGEFQPGQAVYSSIIPENPVVVVPSLTVSNQDDGSRKVQVVRDFVVRDVTINPLAQIGVERLYVAGLFAAGDEVVVSSTAELHDGMRLVPQTEKPKTESKPQSKKKQTDTKTRKGF